METATGGDTVYMQCTYGVVDLKVAYRHFDTVSGLELAIRCPLYLDVNEPEILFRKAQIGPNNGCGPNAVDVHTTV